MAPRVISIGYNTCHYVWMMRANLVQALLAEGHQVVILAPRDEYSERLEEMGAQVVDLPMKMNTNPFTDLLLLLRFRKRLAELKPDVYLGYTAKPNIYGTLAAASLGIPVVNNIAGLGAAFISDGLVTRIVKWLYRVALSRSSLVLFQNPDDAELFASEAIVTHNRTGLLPGSGVDLDAFTFAPMPPRDGRKFRFLLIARMLWDKGIGEFVEAARRIQQERNDVEFVLLGNAAIDNPAAISAATLDEWQREGVVSNLGFRNDVRAEIVAADCVVLPSYREGTPRVLLEAAASGRPVVTTDAVGCREAVVNNETGYLCALKDADDLASKMRDILDLSSEELAEMGRAGRQFAEQKFDEKLVIERYLTAIEQLTRS